MDQYASFAHLGKKLLNWLINMKEKYENANAGKHILKDKMEGHRISNRRELYNICILGFAELKHKRKESQSETEKSLILKD